MERKIRYVEVGVGGRFDSTNVIMQKFLKLFFYLDFYLYFNYIISSYNYFNIIIIIY